MLIGSHIYIFWLLPIRGNITLYGDPMCDMKMYKYYGCRNFHKNVYLRVYYVFFILYLTVSAA